MPDKSFEDLMHGYVNNQLTDEETKNFIALVQQPAYKEKLEAYIGDLMHNRSLAGLSNEIQGQAVFQKIMLAADANNELQEVPKKSIVWMKYAAAAAVLIAFLSLTYIWVLRSSEKKVTAKQQKDQPYKNDVLPGTQKAILTLGDGSVIELDDAQNGTLASQGGTKVIKFNGTINYENAKRDGQTLYNTIATPRGGQYQVVLPDGTEVWLNAASSIHFPTQFSGNERRVELTGEAYFEVKKDARKPFHVVTATQDVEVLGTHFNVNSYSDEPLVKTTLLEGKVKVVKRESAFAKASADKSANVKRERPDEISAVLKPGEQAVMSRANSPLTIHHSPFTIDHSPDLEQVMSWKNGVFQFNNADIKTITRQLARWYNLEIEYSKPPDDNLYFVEMPRNSKLSSILKVLKLTGNIHFEIEGNKLIVS
jgi:transmembrane sensor